MFSEAGSCTEYEFTSPVGTACAAAGAAIRSQVRNLSVVIIKRIRAVNEREILRRSRSQAGEFWESIARAERLAWAAAHARTVNVFVLGAVSPEADRRLVLRLALHREVDRRHGLPPGAVQRHQDLRREHDEREAVRRLGWETGSSVGSSSLLLFIRLPVIGKERDVDRT